MRFFILLFFLCGLNAYAQPGQIKMLTTAESMLSRGDTLSALKEFQSILQHYPDSYPAALRLTEVNYQRKDYRQAIQYSFITEDIIQRHIDSVHVKPSPSSLVSPREKRYMHDLSSIRSFKGKIRLKQDRPIDALHELRLALEDTSEPDSYRDIYLDLGLANYSLNNLEEAKKCFHSALKKDPQSNGALFNLGNVWFADKNLDSASYYYHQTLENNPNFKYPYMYLGDIATQRKEYPLAIDFYSHYLSFDSLSVEAYFKRAVVYAEQREWNKALSDWNKILEYDPENEEAYRNRGLTFFRMERYKEALNDFDKAISESPEPYTFINRGYCYYMIKEPKKALSDYNTGLKDLPEYGLGYYLRALVYDRLKQRKNACADLEKAWSLGYSKEETDPKLEKHCR